MNKGWILFFFIILPAKIVRLSKTYLVLEF